MTLFGAQALRHLFEQTVPLPGRSRNFAVDTELALFDQPVGVYRAGFCGHSRTQNL